MNLVILNIQEIGSLEQYVLNKCVNNFITLLLR
jgi:hypothetical protein